MGTGETKFTPGGWFYEVDGFGGISVGACGFDTYDGSQTIAVFRTPEGIDFATAKANARLAAASPAMYEALDAALEQVRAELNYLRDQGPPKEWKSDVARLSQIVELGDAALTKARGEP